MDMLCIPCFHTFQHRQCRLQCFQCSLRCCLHLFVPIHFQIIFRQCINKVYLLRNVGKDFCPVLEHAAQQRQINVCPCHSLTDVRLCCLYKIGRIHLVDIGAVDCAKLFVIEDCRRLADAADLKGLLQFIQREDFLLIVLAGRCPAQQCDKIDNRFRQIALLHQILEGSIAVSL